MKRVIIFSFLTFLLVNACQKANYSTDKFEIYIPSNLKTTDQIMDTAIIQYYDPTNKYYLALEKTDKNSPIDSFSQENVLSLFEFTDSLKIKNIENQYGKGQIIRFKDDAISDQYYWIVKILPDSNNYYILWLWSDENKYNDNRLQMIEIIKSFRLK